MKYILSTLLSTFIFFFIINNSVAHANDLYEYQYEHEDPAKAHLSANAFTKNVGDLLKERPLKIIAPDVEIRAYRKGLTTVYRFTWSTRIIPVPERDRDWFFDRRGSLLWGPSQESACKNAKEHVRASKKVEDMRKRLSHAKIYESFIKTKSTRNVASGYYCVQEYFAVAPRP